jgi:hypothetical protein
MEANRVGVDKNMANIISSTAKVVGLGMPLEYDHSKEEEGK